MKKDAWMTRHGTKRLDAMGLTGCFITYRHCYMNHNRTEFNLVGTGGTTYENGLTKVQCLALKSP